MSRPDRSTPENSGPGAPEDTAVGGDRASDVVMAVLTAAAQGTTDVDAGVRRLLDWCSGQLAVQARLIQPTAPWRRGDEDLYLLDLGEASTQVAEVAVGRGEQPVQVPGGLVLPVGRPERRELLVVLRARQFTARDVADLVRVCEGLTVLAQFRSVVAREEAVSAVTASLRVSGLQFMMEGDLVTAGRALSPLVPGMIAAGSGSIAVVEAAPAEPGRSGLALDVETAVGPRSLTVLCPVSDRQVIVLHPVGTGQRLEALLEPVVSQVPGRAGGVSRVAPWHAVAAGYLAAVSALATARGAARPGGRPRSGEVRVDKGRAPLAERLGEDARMLAALVLAPLDTLPAAERAELVRVSAQTLWWGPEDASRLLGWHANTLSNRLTRLASVVGLDLADTWQRAGLYLVLRLAQLPPPVIPPSPVTWAQVFNNDRARAWAGEVLDPVGELRDGAVLLTTAAAWIGNDMRRDATCAALGVGKTTLYNRLPRVAAAASLEIPKYPGPALELALALGIAGDLPMGSLPAPARLPAGPTRGIAVPEEPIDTAHPSVARIYDYLAGGSDHFEVDREAAVAQLEHAPYAAEAVRQNRGVMHRQVRFAAEQGVVQFLDLGAGIPTSPNVHEIAQGVNPAARVVYVDHDGSVAAHVRARLTSHPVGSTAYAHADIRSGAALYADPVVTANLDLRQPIMLCLYAVLHFVVDDAYELVRDLVAPLAPGSLLAITHASPDSDPKMMRAAADHYDREVITTRLRTKPEIDQFAVRAGREIEVLEPGTVFLPYWRPESGQIPPGPYHGYAMLARLR